MTLSQIQVRKRGADEVELTAQLRCETSWILESEPFELWYRFPAEVAKFLDAENADPFLVALLAPAMALGEPLTLAGKVSPRLLQGAKRAQEIYRCWKPTLQRIEVKAAADRSPAQANNVGTGGTGLFFSLGVDSGYSLAKNLRGDGVDGGAVTDLITVLGFDVYLWEQHRFTAMRGNVEQVGAALGKEVLSVTTNLRDFSDKIVDWVQLYHGAALASVVLSLGEKFSRVSIAATHTYADLLPLGSHPLLDPLWSTERLSFIHDGCEATRLEKLRLLAEVPALVKTLRVCATGEVTDAYNCGCCPKCLMTMIGVHIVDDLQRWPTLPNVIDLERVRSIEVKNSTQRIYLDQLVQALSEAPRDREIRRALQDCLG